MSSESTVTSVGLLQRIDAFLDMIGGCYDKAAQREANALRREIQAVVAPVPESREGQPSSESPASIGEPAQFVAGVQAEIEALREKAARDALAMVARHCDAKGLEFRVHRPHGRLIKDLVPTFLDKLRPGGGVVVVGTGECRRLADLVIRVSNALYSIPACRYADWKWTFESPFKPAPKNQEERT